MIKVNKSHLFQLQWKITQTRWCAKIELVLVKSQEWRNNTGISHQSKFLAIINIIHLIIISNQMLIQSRIMQTNSYSFQLQLINQSWVKELPRKYHIIMIWQKHSHSTIISNIQTRLMVTSRHCLHLIR